MRVPRARLTIHPAIPTAAILFCIALLYRLLWPIHLIVGELTALVSLALGFRYWPPMKTWFAGMPSAHRVVFFLIFAAILLGHFQFDNRKYFPFISWEIFSNVREVDPVSCPEFLATTQDGKQVRLLTEQLFPSIIQFYAPAGADSLQTAALVQVLARAYNRTHPSDPAVRVDLVQMSVKLHPGVQETSFPTCQLLKRYDVSSDRSN